MSINKHLGSDPDSGRVPPGAWVAHTKSGSDPNAGFPQREVFLRNSPF